SAARRVESAAIDRLAALRTASDRGRRGATISLSGVYGGMVDPLPMLTLFDEQIQLRMAQANVHRWAPQILPLLDEEDVLGVEDFASDHVALQGASEAYRRFQAKKDGIFKTVFKP